MKTILLTFDLEEFPAEEFEIPISKKEAYKIGFEGTKVILNLLKKHKIQATCFVTYEFAKKYKRIIKELESIGCEIACHGYNHTHRYNKMPQEEALKYLKYSIKGLQNLGFKINGFRAPQMSRPDYKIIEKAGFKYDSSLHPAWIPGYYNNFFEKREIQNKNNLAIVPLSVSPFLRLPMAWLWFRNFGLTYEKVLTRLNFLDKEFTNVYMHPWEFVDINNEINRRYMSRLIIRKTGDKFVHMLDEYIKWCRSKNYKFSTISNYMNIK